MDLSKRWGEVPGQQRLWIFGGSAVTVMGVFLTLRWLSYTRDANRRGRMKRGAGASPPPNRRKSLNASDSFPAAHSRNASSSSSTSSSPSSPPTSSSPLSTHPPTPGNDGPPLYPYDFASTSSTTQDPSLPSPPPPPSSTPSAAHQRTVSVSNEEPREQLFYDLLSLTAGAPVQPTPTAVTVDRGGPAHKRLPSSPLPQPSSAASSTSSSSSSSSSPSPLPSPSPAVDPLRMRALQAKWERDQRRKEKRARRAARSALDAVSTASPSPSFSSASSSMSLDSPLDGLDEGSTSFDYEEQMGEEVKEDPQVHLHSPSAPSSRSPARRRYARDHSSPIVKRLNGLFTQQQPEAREARDARGGRKGEEDEEEMKM